MLCRGATTEISSLANGHLPVSFLNRPRDTLDLRKAPLSSEASYPRPLRATSEALTCTCSPFGTCTACRAARPGRPRTASRLPLTGVDMPMLPSKRLRGRSRRTMRTCKHAKRKAVL